jgi:hypothetical protein
VVIAADPPSDEASEEQILPDADVAHLRLRGLTWSASFNGQMIDLVIHDYPVPAGYDQTCVDLLLQLPGSWPDGTPDMFYVDPPMRVAATRAWPKAADHFPVIGGRKWQRWSRHFQAVWRPGIDGVATHLAIVNDALAASVR